MIISLIAAMTVDRIIGIKNTMPWHLYDDLIWFKKHTNNKPVIMGRKTFDAIKKPLSGRLNIVLSRNFIPSRDQDIIWVDNPIKALIAAGNVTEVMVIGGAQIYNIFILQAHRLYLTHIDINIKGDTWFPHYHTNQWRVTFRKYHNDQEKNLPRYYFEILERMTNS
ncbi:type 3 dihydrofolate reductase [Candidatus Palibaumannia cicadellinicola]|uniref:Dihydrofolate reductase n=1 Tax=Baumannia cicadellinicola subsp. Homalodisca coagulata TaxID=374463 RepID=Q1LSS4_BAUCH|nr:type 3 dihydrofolate reductase [Candidatus Baumannia cicadellinicola]ABF14188.1 dihydrofolate reductase [Baumannia cicadellinicola str. Hc (Homalodisca coagulata)]MBS0032893.1 type 3 dihydrofolate reductase [Candidatus Baumannia cicadellinicola]MCJ7462148.1 type 3 dihydrofolate reductase [Candidatus Baumannia cicadellinicola]MCJ7463118.1 type 3 dihydrofolate reductase [Candidatus Baumannia cicadellinicola]